MNTIAKLFFIYKKRRRAQILQNFICGMKSYSKEMDKKLIDSWRSEISNTGMLGSRNQIQTNP